MLNSPNSACGIHQVSSTIRAKLMRRKATVAGRYTEIEPATDVASNKAARRIMDAGGSMRVGGEPESIRPTLSRFVSRRLVGCRRCWRRGGVVQDDAQHARSGRDQAVSGGGGHQLVAFAGSTDQ